MATARTNHLSDNIYVIRPILVEARLMTEKHARDTTYVVALTEELREVESRINTMKGALGLCSSEGPLQPTPYETTGEASVVNWIRAKSRELNLRLRWIEQSSKPR